MPRPRKCRRVCCMPKRQHFGPLDVNNGGEAHIQMTVDEFETIRLIDLENLTQEECAALMGIARTTAQAIYNSARMKLAECIIYGRKLHIHGGDYTLCGKHDTECHCGRCPKKFIINKIQEEKNMTIAIPYENGAIFQHFGKSEAFKLYEVSERKITDSHVVSTNGNGHGALAKMLKNLNVSVLICGGIGSGAKKALTENGIQIFGGVSGEADKAADDYLSETLSYNPDIACDHHHDENHVCSDHDSH